MSKKTVTTEKDMIQITIRLFTVLRKATGKKEVIINIEKDRTIEELIKYLCKTYEKLGEEILNENNEIKQWIQILINGRNIKYLKNLETRLKNGDIIVLFPPTAGGNKYCQFYPFKVP